MKEILVILMLAFIVNCSNQAKMSSNDRVSRQSSSSNVVVAEAPQVAEDKSPVVEVEPKEEIVVEEEPEEEIVIEEEPEEEEEIKEEPKEEEDLTPKCNEGESLVNGICIVSKFDKCTEFVELTITTIPSLEKTGKCYYKKIISGIPNQPSGNGFDQATDVFAARHGVAGVPTGHPWVLGDFMETFIFDLEEGESKRNISLSGDFVADIEQLENYPVKIDNFLLIEITANNANTVRFARGTGDSVPAGDYIRVNDEPVTDFISYAGGGIATIDILDLSTSFERGIATDVRIRMLDAGGSASASDLFLIIH